jgi:hypothetical protein
MLRDFARECPARHLQFVRRVVRVGDVLQAPPHQLIPIESRDRAEGGVRVDEPEVGAEERDPYRSAVTP